MYTGYPGTLNALYADDVSGIQAIYGTRPADAYDAVLSNGSFLTASNLTAAISPTTLTALTELTEAGCQTAFASPLPRGGPVTVRRALTLARRTRDHDLGLAAPTSPWLI